MTNAARRTSIVRAIGGRARLIAAVFLATTAGVFLVGSYFAPHYTAAAILMHALPTGSSVAPWHTDTPSAPESHNTQISDTQISDEQIKDMNQRLHLYPELVTKLAPQWAIAATRHNFLLTSIPDAFTSVPGATMGAERVRITYVGRDKDTVLRVTNALAAALSHAQPSTSEQESYSRAEARTAVSQPVDTSPGPTASVQKNPPTQGSLLTRTGAASPVTLNELRRRLNSVGERQAELETQLRQQTSALEALQQERTHLGDAAKDTITGDRERQLSRHNAAEQALRSQLASATQTMNDLGKRYTQSYPEYLSAKDRVDDLQSKLNQFQSRPFVFVPEPPADNSKQLAEFNHQETAIKATLQILQQQLDLNESDSRRVQTQVMRWSAANAPVESLAPKSPSPARAPSPSTAAPLPATASSGPGFTILQDAVLLSASPRINIGPLTLISLAFGLIAACTTVLLLGAPLKLVRSEEDLLNQLPAGIRYLGGIPRIHHEIITR